MEPSRVLGGLALCADCNVNGQAIGGIGDVDQPYGVRYVFDAYRRDSLQPS
jgi:hypothetical protein